MAKRTTRTFPATSNLWDIVDAWAREMGFEALPQEASCRRYRKGRDYFDFPIMLHICSDGNNVQFETWVKASGLDRGRALFLIPAEMALESGGAQMLVARNNGRKLVNSLLARLGQAAIP